MPCESVGWGYLKATLSKSRGSLREQHTQHRHSPAKAYVVPGGKTGSAMFRHEFQAPSLFARQQRSSKNWLQNESCQNAQTSYEPSRITMICDDELISYPIRSHQRQFQTLPSGRSFSRQRVMVATWSTISSLDAMASKQAAVRHSVTRNSPTKSGQTKLKQGGSRLA